jgi:hypothetical protein
VEPEAPPARRRGLPYELGAPAPREPGDGDEGDRRPSPQRGDLRDSAGRPPDRHRPPGGTRGVGVGQADQPAPPARAAAHGRSPRGHSSGPHDQSTTKSATSAAAAAEPNAIRDTINTVGLRGVDVILAHRAGRTLVHPPAEGDVVSRRRAHSARVSTRGELTGREESSARTTTGCFPRACCPGGTRMVGCRAPSRCSRVPPTALARDRRVQRADRGRGERWSIGGRPSCIPRKGDGRESCVRKD